MKRNPFFVIMMIATLFFASCKPQEVSFVTKEYVTSTNYQNTIAITSSAYNYVGTMYPSLPDSITKSSSWGALISPSITKDWEIAAVKGREYMLWFSKSISRTPQGKAIFQVSDVIIVDHPEKDYVILVSSCLINSTLDPEIIALAKLDEQSLTNRFLYNASIVSAWRANRSTGKFEMIDTKNIECYAETFLNFP
jgi:hypothetical protein